jgi:acetylornithine deacetylase
MVELRHLENGTQEISMHRRTFLTVTALAFATVVGKKSRAQQHARIDGEELIELASELARIPSFTTEESDCARFLHDYFLSEGLESELQEVDPGRLQTIARVPGTGGGRSLMLNGHIDIDPIPDGVSGDPWTPAVKGDVLFGAGLGNMKGGMAAMALAAVALKRARVPLRGDLVVACVVGELQGGPGTVHLLRSGIRTDMAIVGEPSGAEFIRTKHAGVVQLGIHVIGRSTHISVKEEGINAIVKMAKVADAVENLELRGPRDPELPALPLVNVGSIIGGRGRNVELRGPNNVPDFCSIFVDFRFPNGMTPDTVVSDLRRRLDELKADDPEMEYEIEFPLEPERRMLREVMMPFSAPIDAPVVQTLKNHVTTIRGEQPQLGTKLPNGYGGTDASHLFPAGISSCIYGPGARGEGPDRYLGVSISEMLDCSRAYAATAETLCA